MVDEMSRQRQLATRQSLIDEGRSLTITGPAPQQPIKPNQHFYLLGFTGKVALPQLLRSGTYRNESRGAESQLGSGRRSPGSRQLALVVWDGETTLARHPSNRIGLLLGHDDSSPEEATYLVVASLEGIEYVDERPAPQRTAHPLPDATSP